MNRLLEGLRRPRVRFACLLALVVVSVLACNAVTGAGDIILDDSGTSAAGGASSGTLVGQGGANAGAIGAGGSCATTCSPDLHSVIDCNGNTIKECPPDQGCSPDGSCVSACESASEHKSTFGCDFYSVTPAVIAEARGSCFAVMIANTWNSDITLSAEYGGQTIDTASYLYTPQGSGGTLSYTATGGLLKQGEFGILFLSKYESGDVFQTDCPVPQALEMSTQLDGTGRGKAFRIRSDRPVVAYDVYPWGGASSFVTSATLLLPTPSWGTNFVTSDAWEALHGNPFTQFVAAQDGTTVTIVPTNTVNGGGGIPAMAANTASSFTLNRGEVVQLLQATRLAGSTVQADKPIAVWGGSSCMNIPSNKVACDGAHQQLLPVQLLGNEYVGVRYPSRGGDDSAPYTLVGMIDGTQLSYDNMPTGAPGSLNRGDVSIFFTDQVFSVASQDADHPFYVAAHMTGAATNPSGAGDPEYVNVVPPAQYLPRYLFVTDPTYKNTSLVFVRQRGSDGDFHDVTLACAGTLSGWTSVGSSGKYEYLQLKLVENGAGQQGCDNGVHTAHSDVPFGLTVWGYDKAASYAYPAGMSVDTINTVVVKPVPK
ncbi:MAG: IgGFc-binding protein [Polyangiaceae bacterium]